MYNHNYLLYIFSTNYSPSNNELIVNTTKGLKVHFTTWHHPSGCIFTNLQTIRGLRCHVHIWFLKSAAK